MTNNLYKYAALYLLFFISLFGLYYPIDIFSQEGVKLQKEILLKQAQTHFNDQVNTRKWNAMYGGIYVKPRVGELPNQYLKNNILKVDENLTLLKINPAWMTRQLSEISDIKDFKFHITSLTPINPKNKATAFEKKALKYFESTKNREYYELNDGKFNYMGALITIKSCLPCHQHQGYKVGDIRGGISVYLDSSKYEIITKSIQENALIVKVFVLLFLLSITVLIHRQFKNNERLQVEVVNRTKEIESTRELLQKILDSDKSFLALYDDVDIVYVNKTLLDFFGFETLDEFKNRYEYIADVFEDVDDDLFLTHYEVDGEHWVNYLKRNQIKMGLKVLIKKDGVDRYFKPYVKEIDLDGKKQHLVTFDEITDEYIKMQQLEQKASRDTLTKLFNRDKFNEVLLKGLALSDESDTAVSLIFIDIDYFKTVNDTYGHDEGDKVLIGLAEVLLSTVRQADFVARWGGEEFIVIMHSANSEQAAKVAEKLRVKFESYTFENVGNQTMSSGVTEYINGEDKEKLLKRVDEALYEAKNSGRNRVVVK